jgi:hypothetical protein
MILNLVWNHCPVSFQRPKRRLILKPIPTGEKPGVELIVELSAKPKGVLHVPVRVVHATAGKNGRWIIGCEFARPLSEDELQTLI